MNWKRKRGRRLTAAFSLPMLLILAAFFFCGLILGQVLASRLSPATGEELRRYLSDFLLLEGVRGNRESVFFSTLCLYLRYPLLAFLAGFASIGIFVLPCITAVFSCLLSFSVCCFTATFGVDGVLLALAVFGLRCVVTFPCYFLMAEASMKRSAVLARMSFGRGRMGPISPGSREWRRIAIMFGILLLGVFADLLFSPRFLRLALEQIHL